MSFSWDVDNIETFETMEDLRAARHRPNEVIHLKTFRPRGDVDPEIPEEWVDRPVIKASDSPALAKRRADALAKQRQLAKRRGRLEEFDRQLQDEEAAFAERERIDATAREQLEEEAEEAIIERTKARLRREAEAFAD